MKKTFKQIAKVTLTALMAASLTVGCAAIGEEADVASYTTDNNVVLATEVGGTALNISGDLLDPLVIQLDEEKFDYDYELNQTEVSGDVTKLIFSDGNSISIDGNHAEVVGKQIIISASGTYVLTGELENASLYIDAQDEGLVHLIFDQVSLSNSETSPIYIEEAEEVIITLAEGSENRIIDSSDQMTQDLTGEENLAAIFSKDDLTINGSGSLTVDATVKNAIVSNDGLVIESGTLNVTSGNNGLKGKDYLIVLDGEINIVAGEDGLKSKDYIEVQNGTITIDSVEDAFHSDNAVVIKDGTITINAGDDGIHGDIAVAIYDGTIDIQSSYEGIEAFDIAFYDGSISVVADDDGINVADPEAEDTEAGGMEGPGQRPEGGPMFQGTDLETEEGQQVMVTMEGTATETEMTLQGRGQGQGGQMGGMPVDIILEGHGIRIYGGSITIDSMGDGVDSNGHILMTGGNLKVDGPVTKAQGAIDYNGSFDFQGGTIQAAGSYGMSQSVSDLSCANSVLYMFTEVQEAGSTIKITDASGTVVAEHTASKEYQTFVFASEALITGTTYNVTVDGVVLDTFSQTTHLITGNEAMVNNPEPGPRGSIGL